MATYLAAFFVADAGGAARDAVVGAHADAAGLSAADSAHQASAPGAEPVHGLSLARRVRRIPPLGGDEDFGLVAGTDLTRLVSLQAYSCVECGRCMEHCPANNTGKLLNPKEIVLGVRGYLNESGPASRRAAAGQIHLAGGGVSVHHLRRVRIPVPGGH